MYPDAIDALKLQANLFLSMGNKSCTLNDIERIIQYEQDKDYAQYSLLRCMILESLAPDNKEAILLCYAQAAQAMRLHSSPEELARCGYYVRMVILAESPDAESVRQRFLDSLDPTKPFDVMEGDSIRLFDRSKLKSFFDLLDHAASTYPQQ